jgi:hypothetical protein
MAEPPFGVDAVAKQQRAARDSTRRDLMTLLKTFYPGAPVFGEDALLRCAKACKTDQSLVTVLATVDDGAVPVVTLREEFPALSRDRSDPAKVAQEAPLVMRSVEFSFYFALMRCVPLEYHDIDAAAAADGTGPGWRALRLADHLRKHVAVELLMMAASKSNLAKQVQEEVGQDVPTYVSAIMKLTEDQRADAAGSTRNGVPVTPLFRAAARFLK